MAQNPPEGFPRITPHQSGHWRLMGVSSGRALPTYPQGFPDEVVEIVSRASGRGVICNRPGLPGESFV